MTGYIRKDTTNSIANGEVIDADVFDLEFDGVVAAFNSSSGHTHGGAVGEGAPITVVGPAQDFVVSSAVARPKTTNTIDLGTSSLRFKDIYLSGSVKATDPSLIRTDLGLGTAALVNTGTGASDVPTITQADARYLEIASNLSDLASASTARTNLGLGTAALVNTGTGASDLPTTTQADARYARLGSTNAFTGANSFTQTVTVNKNGGHIDLTRPDSAGQTVSLASLAGPSFGVYLNGAEVGVAEAAGTSASSTRTIITREKGDARYAALGGSPSQSFSVDRLFVEDTGTAGAPAIRMGDTAASGFSTTLAGDVVQVSVNNAFVARFDAGGTSASNATTVITREKGDSRYAALSGSSSVNFSVAALEVEGLGSAANPAIRSSSSSSSTGITFAADGGIMAFVVSGAAAARVDPAGTSIPATNTVITREKGDARYLEISLNLSDLANVTTARSNLGLGTAAVVDTGTGATNVPTVAQADARYAAIANAWPGIYNGTDSQYTTYPVGTVISALANFSAANTAVSIYVTPAGSFTTSSSGNTLLSGTWRARGNSDGTFMTFQRTA
jgi:hypothetical protein